MASIVYGREFELWSLQEIHFIVSEKMKKVDKNAKVLDFPSGPGRLSWMLHNEGFKVTAADIGPENFRNPEIPIFKADLDSRFPFDDGLFDYCFCIDGPEHSENIYHTFREFSRMLKLGGILTFSIPNHSNIESRLRQVFYAVLEPVEPFKDSGTKNNGHLSRPSFPLLKMALQHAGLEIVHIQSEKVKYNQLWLSPIALIINVATKLKGKKAEKKYWLNESNSFKILLGGNGIIVTCKKVR
jgi:2-polyprenyl-3-methyl-5-hydroxy-6-metoxy-1,4-benzoquinol methylase